MSELLLGLKTAWLTSAVSCLYSYPSPREETCHKEFCFQEDLLLLLWFFCSTCGKLTYQSIGPKKGKFIQTQPNKHHRVSNVPFMGGRAHLKDLLSATAVLLPCAWEMPLHPPIGVSEMKPQYPEFCVEIQRHTITSVIYLLGTRHQAVTCSISEQH